MGNLSVKTNEIAREKMVTSLNTNNAFFHKFSQDSIFHAEQRNCEDQRFLMTYTYGWHSINPKVPI